MTSEANGNENLGSQVKLEAARKEIEYRTNAQLALFTLNIAAIGALGALYASKDLPKPLFLLLIALISPTIGFQWLDHALTIDRLGDYCRKLGYDWEKHVAKQRLRPLRRTLFLSQVFIAFGGSNIISLVILAQRKNYFMSGWIWGSGWVVSFLLLLCFIGVFVSYWCHPNSEENSVSETDAPAHTHD